MLEKYRDFIKKASEMGLKAYFLDVREIPIENRTSLKCAYGCKSYGKRLSCPPYITSIDEFRKIIAEYTSALLLVDEHVSIGVNDLFEAWSKFQNDSFHKMFELEQEAFRSGFTFAHLLRPGPCNECKVCNLQNCIKPEMRRFPPEAVGINLHKTMEDSGLVLEFCKPDKISCIGLLLLE